MIVGTVMAVGVAVILMLARVAWRFWRWKRRLQDEFECWKDGQRAMDRRLFLVERHLGRFVAGSPNPDRWWEN